jgi:hypothetical protein
MSSLETLLKEIGALSKQVRRHLDQKIYIKWSVRFFLFPEP